ncbi:hypothetical protein ACQ33O_09380 [Ferruginibacter sp. SUN002]|uniref:hypothetical protein n=1 Tax=Ferruginibacter sp. SUN002 TaxID=2937789 RepID=UPI003D3608DB
MKHCYPLFILLLASTLFTVQVKSQSSAEYKNTIQYQKIVTQIKDLIENIGSNLSAYKGDAIEKADAEDGAEYFAIKKPILLSSDAYITHYKDGDTYKANFSFAKFDNNADAGDFGKRLTESLKKGVYSFGTLKSVTSGAEGLIELEVVLNKKATSKKFSNVHIFIKIPNKYGNSLENEVRVSISRWE